MNFNRPLWVEQSVFYQIFPERFCNGDATNDPIGVAPWGATPELDNHFGGDLQGILDRLPYLKDLGVNAIYLTPIFKARTNHKYDASDYLEIDPAFGDLKLFKTLVRLAHQEDMHIILDGVFNHCGDGFWAFRDVMERGQDSPYKNWFYPEEYPFRQSPATYQTCGGASFLPKMNLSNPATRDYLLQVARYWLEETGMDGWRLDVPWKVAPDYWREFREVVKKVNPQAYIVAEAWRDPGPWVTGETTDGIMNYPLRDYILDFCVFDRMDAEDFFYFTSRLLQVYADAAPYQLNLLDSHDTARLLTVCKQDLARMKLALVAMFTLPGTPMIYYGDEIGLLGGDDPDCRRCMNWNRAEWNQELNDFYRKLISLHRGHAALQTGSLDGLMTFNGVLAYRRKLENDEIIVILNPRETRESLLIDLGDQVDNESCYLDVLSGQEIQVVNRELRIERSAAKTAMILIPVG